MKLRLVVAVSTALLAWSAGAARSVAAAPGATCTGGATESLVRAFVRDYSRGRVAAIDRMWAPEPRFEWFSTGRPGARLDQSAHERATLTPYFRARARNHERIRVTAVQARYDPKRNLVNFGGKLVRSADDLRPRPHDFKGAADCESGRPVFIVWSM